MNGDATGSPAMEALVKLGHSSARQPEAAELARGLSALHTRIARGRERQGQLVRGSLVAAAVLVMTLLGLQVAAFSRHHWTTPEPTALTYRVEGGSVLEGGYLRASGDAGIKLAFSEGSEFVLTPGTRGRLRAVDERGAGLAIESGTAHFQITPSAERRWWVEVGPFLVTIRGTLFTVSWDPEAERFELQLQRGRVDVSGPVSDGSLALRAGQRLVVDLARGETRILEDHPGGALPELDAAAGSSTPPHSSITAPAAMSAPPAPASVEKSKPAKAQRRWADELASGNWDGILRDVEQAGVETTLNSASSEELFAVADAARYRRRTGLAYAALMAHRRRFPGSPRTLFLLGRVEESRGGQAPAIAWYDEYLARAPAGAYAAEALGRKMTITNKVGGPAKAKPIAEAYLRRFPKGSYVGSARAILRVP